MKRKRSDSQAGEKLSDAVDRYLDVGSQRRARTRELYSMVLRRTLLPWCEANGIERVDQLDERAVSRWVDYLGNEHATPRGGRLSPASIATYVRTVNQMLRSTGTETRARAPRPKRKLLDVLSREEIAKLEDAAVTERDKLLIRVLADTGMRLGEVLAMREDHIAEPMRRTFAIRVPEETKGGERLVPIEQGLCRRLRRYCERARPADYHGPYIFVGLRKGRDGRYHVPGRGAVAHMIREAADRAGFKPGRVHAHLLRHSAITFLLRRGVNPITVAQIAGHESLEMIRSVYSHLTIADSHAAMMRALQGGDDG